MTVLSDKQILDELGKTVIIDPFIRANLNTASHDVRLGEWFFYESPNPAYGDRLYNMYDETSVKRTWLGPFKAEPAKIRLKNVKEDDKIIFLKPKQNLLCHTIEFIGGRKNCTTVMKARSSIGRNLVVVCQCAGQGDVGYYNRWTMEVSNKSEFYTIPLIVGRRIAQIVFYQTGELFDDKKDYIGSKYQLIRELEKLKRQWRPSMMLPKMFLDRECFYGKEEGSAV